MEGNNSATYQMVTKLTLLFIFILVERSSNVPLKQFREAKAAHAVPLLVPHQSTLTLTPHVIVTPPRIQKSPNVIAIPISQILVPKLHVIPISHSNIRHSAVHTDVNHIVTNNNIHIPVISHTISHSTTNITHPTPTVPFLISYPHNLVPIHDLSVLPIQKPVHTVHKTHQQIGHYRVMAKKNIDIAEEPINYVRTIYGGFGTGLYFGGQGAGHGFHVFG